MFELSFFNRELKHREREEKQLIKNKTKLCSTRRLIWQGFFSFSVAFLLISHTPFSAATFFAQLVRVERKPFSEGKARLDVRLGFSSLVDNKGHNENPPKRKQREKLVPTLLLLFSALLPLCKNDIQMFVQFTVPPSLPHFSMSNTSLSRVQVLSRKFLYLKHNPLNVHSPSCCFSPQRERGM